jgi:hypothetical protein
MKIQHPMVQVACVNLAVVDHWSFAKTIEDRSGPTPQAKALPKLSPAPHELLTPG